MKQNPYDDPNDIDEAFEIIDFDDDIIIDHDPEAEAAALSKKPDFKRRRLSAIGILCGIFLLLAGFGCGYWLGYDRSYHDGYEKGFFLGGDLGYNDGFTKGLKDAETVTTATAASEDDDTTVYILGNGKKYHTADCAVIQSGGEVTAITVQEAENLDYTPCSRCFKK